LSRMNDKTFSSSCTHILHLTQETWVDQEKDGKTYSHKNGTSKKMEYSLLLMRPIAVCPLNHSPKTYLMLRSTSDSCVDCYVKVTRSHLVHVSCIRTPVGSVLLPAPALVCFLKSQAGVKQLAGVGHVTAIIMEGWGGLGWGYFTRACSAPKKLVRRF
jgi:hypothetical protein